MFSPSRILKESLEIRSEFEIAFANNISKAIPITAAVVIIYFKVDGYFY
jgi:hypothetical protein